VALEEDLVAGAALLAPEEVVEADLEQLGRDANEAMCPPTPSSGRLARDTMAAAFQRTIASSRRSSSSSPG
jgi:hypothetical protein